MRARPLEQTIQTGCSDTMTRSESTTLTCDRSLRPTTRAPRMARSRRPMRQSLLAKLRVPALRVGPRADQRRERMVEEGRPRTEALPMMTLRSPYGDDALSRRTDSTHTHQYRGADPPLHQSQLTSLCRPVMLWRGGTGPWRNKRAPAAHQDTEIASSPSVWTSRVSGTPAWRSGSSTSWRNFR